MHAATTASGPTAWRGVRGADGSVAGCNDRDALACAGCPGVRRVSPLVPGIDATGRVVVAP